MLILSRRIDEAVIVEGDIEIRVLDVTGQVVKLGFTAPDEVEILREELLSDEQEQSTPVQ